MTRCAIKRPPPVRVADALPSLHCPRSQLHTSWRAGLSGSLTCPRRCIEPSARAAVARKKCS